MLVGIGCENTTTCAMIGGDGHQFHIYYSTDSFNSFHTATFLGQPSGMFLDIALDNLGNGATAGLGVGAGSALTYTTNVTQWQGSTDKDFVTGQDMVPMGNGQFGFVGETSGFVGLQGVMISTDSGRDWVAANWPANISALLAPARYGAFPSAQAMYVTGGAWPQTNRFGHADDCVPLSAKTCVPGTAKAAAHMRQRYSKGNGAYAAIITKSTDGGKTWTVQFQDNGNFYMNDISCADENTCFAVGEGFSDGGAAGARIYGTTNGGATWPLLYTDKTNNASLMRVHAVSATEAFAAGSGTIYHSTDAGASWVLEGSFSGVGDFTGFACTAGGTACFAVGETEFQTAVLAVYTA